ncbi:MAG: serine/threonine protein kinase [Gemmatimonadales bacterium]
MALDSTALIGRSIGPYVPHRLIGAGGFSWVFAAHHSDGREVALKVLKPRYAGDKEFETRFRNESDFASQLTHPNVARILDIGQDQGFTYFSMDLYPDSLTSQIEREGTLGEAALVRIATDVAKALAFAHENGIIHRDIKVDNILLNERGDAVISDFGIARAVSGYVSATGVNMTIGTPQYISPEQAQGRKLDGRSDLYALGVTLYKATTGELPFRSSDWFELARMHVEDLPIPPREKRPDISARFERIILRCLAKHPDDRYESAKVLIDELNHIADKLRRTSMFGTAPMDIDPAFVEQPRRLKWLVPVAAVAVVVIVAVLVLVLGR